MDKTETRSEVARGLFVAKITSLLEEAFSENSLNFTTACVMNYAEVQVCLPYDEYRIVLGRKDKEREHTFVFRICDDRGEDTNWFPPFFLDESANQNEFLHALRARLMLFHNRLMG